MLEAMQFINDENLYNFQKKEELEKEFSMKKNLNKFLIIIHYEKFNKNEYFQEFMSKELIQVIEKIFEK